MFRHLNRPVSIGLLLNRCCIVISMVLVMGISSSAFAVDFSQVLEQSKQDVFSLWDLAEGKPVVSNLYTKALKIAKHREVDSSVDAFDHLADIYATCPWVETQDFINVLYNANTSFRTTFVQLFPSANTPTKRATNKSYSKFLTCKWRQSTPTAIANINTEINGHYFDMYSNTYTLDALNSHNFWSDLFWNGTLDDSSFDLLYDIQQIGNILFEDFVDSPQVLFYRLPSLSSSSSVASDASSAYQLGGGGGSFPWTDSYGANSDLFLDDVGGQDDDNVEDVYQDAEILDFIDSNASRGSSSDDGGDDIFANNQCIVPWTPDEWWSGWEEEILMDPEAYLSWIADFMNAALSFDLDISLFDQSDDDAQDSQANTYAEAAFGSPQAGTCEYTCQQLPLLQQPKCELDCAVACIQSCDEFSSLTDKAICVSDCTCFMISGPNGAWREKMEDMYRIKFCKVPVQQQSAPSWKKVKSIQAIFQVFSDIFEGLRDSGQMTKFTKTHEFLDGNIKINFVENFAFSISMAFKPLFAQMNASITRQQEEQEQRDLSTAVLDINVSSPETDDYNKYIVVSDPIKNKANSEPFASLADLQKNIDVFDASYTSTKHIVLDTQYLSPLVDSYASSSRMVIIQHMIDFLTDNQNFWSNMSMTLLDMNAMTFELKNKIEAAK